MSIVLCLQLPDIIIYYLFKIKAFILNNLFIFISRNSTPPKSMQVDFDIWIMVWPKRAIGFYP